MEKLNALGSSLPPEQPPTDQAITSLNSELSQEFKIAANAVTKLYRVANERNSLLKHRGYLNCLEDLLEFIQQDSKVTASDVHLWCLKQRNDILSHQSHGNSNSKLDFNFENGIDHGNTDLSSPKFMLSKPPMSVEHQHNQHHGHTKSRKLRSSTIKKQHIQTHQSNQHDTWKAVDKFPIQNVSMEYSQADNPTNDNARTFSDRSPVSAPKKQKASVPGQTQVKQDK